MKSNTTKDVRRCARCVLPEQYPEIRFDEYGVCHRCRAYTSPPLKGEEALKKIVPSKKGEKYDCIVAFSGGSDSTYVVWYVTQVLHLKTLAATYDNGFRHPVALENARETCRRAGADFLQVQSKDNLNARIASAAVRCSIPFGPRAAASDTAAEPAKGSYKVCTFAGKCCRMSGAMFRLLPWYGMG